MEDGIRIRSSEQLAAFQQAGAGYILNADIPTASVTAHRADCRTLTTEAFEQKVLEGKGVTGGWYFKRDDPGDAARRCRICL